MMGHGRLSGSGGIGALASDPAPARSALGGKPRGGILGRALRSQPLWLTLGYFAVLLLLAHVYA